ncbi:MAG: hypothetical protein KDC91_05645 [Flavobacteriaceae bacterium]|nr:hypothetical protein [Flavobacteriaceae bacterium]
MTKTVFLLLLIVFPFYGWGQIQGTFVQDGYPYPMVKVYFEGISGKASSSFEGNFQLKIPQDSIPNHLIINYNGITLTVTDCPLENGETLDFGTFILPKFKQLTIEEYHALKRKNRKQCLPLYQGSNIVGYQLKNELEASKLQLYCDENKGVSNFIFDKKRNAFTTSWENFIHCN